MADPFADPSALPRVTATFESACPVCEEWIEVGDPIYQDWYGAWVCKDCSTP